MRTEKEDLLLTAAEFNNLDLVKQCITGGFLGLRGKVSIETMDDENLTALHWAAYKGFTELAKWLVDHGADVDSQADGFTPLMAAVKSGSVEIVKHLLDNGADIQTAKTGDDEGATALFFALGQGHETVANLLLDEGARTDARKAGNHTPLMRAAESGLTSVVERLLETGADVDEECTGDANHWTALTYAASEGNTAACRMLLKYGATVDMATESGWTPLHWAVRDGYIDTVRVLLDGGANPDRPKNDGWTPLMLAVYNGKDDIVELLLKRKADLDQVDEIGESAVFKAVEKQFPKTVRLLLEAGARYDTLNHNKDSLLHHAIIHNNTEALQVLVAMPDMQVSVGDADGWAPLLRAVESGKWKSVRILLDNGGADPNPTTPDGLNARDLAAFFGFKHLEKILAECGVARTQFDDIRSVAGSRKPLAGSAGYPELTTRHFEVELVDSASMSPGGSGDADFQQAISCLNEQQDGTAEDLFRSALQAGLDPLREGYARANIGLLCINRGELDDAVKMMVSVLESRRALYESAHDAAERLAIVYGVLGRDTEAAGLRELASQTAAKLGHTLSPDAARRTEQLARAKLQES